MQNVTLKLPLSTLALLHRVAQDEGRTLGDIARDAISRDLAERTRAKAETVRSAADAPAITPVFGTRRLSRAS